jgi:aspartokinase
VVNPENGNDDLETEGQVHLMIIIGPACKETPVKVVETVYNLLSQQAEIYAFMTQPSSTEISIKILIEFSDAEAAAAIICRFHGFATEVSC